MNFTPLETKIAIIGLGYVGLPLAVAFAEKYPVIGFDINAKRIQELNDFNDSTLEIESNELNAVLSKDVKLSKGLFCTTDRINIADCNIYIVTVPTPVDKYNRPDLTPILKASETVAAVLSHGNVVIYESTVYPGVTEDECVPVLERLSGLKFNHDFVAGYSPERINPGDKERTVKKIKKVTSGSTPEAADYIDNLYSSVINAGTHKAPSIRVAEAAKVIENAQRDINIAFVNELAKIFNRLQIDTHSVLEAAGTKWNFLPYKPGLVGGHCIGVDPYYLAQKAQETGYHPEIILAGRRLNDGMGEYVANEVIFQMIRKGNVVKDSKVLILGITFKENCPDIRNSRVIDVIKSLKKQGVELDVFDPFANAAEVHHEYNLDLITDEKKLNETYHAVILAVAHQEFINKNWRNKLIENGVLYDVKGVLNINTIDSRL
jgi:UDP-N-acetyl-D-galactosamine dehydrogenase